MLLLTLSRLCLTLFYCITSCRGLTLVSSLAAANTRHPSGSTIYSLDENGRPIDAPSNRQLLSVTLPNQRNKTINLQTPHSGRKFHPTHPNYSKRKSKIRSLLKAISFRNNRRFTEGWYYRLTLPEYNESFVFIFSIEDAGRWVPDNNTDNNNSYSLNEKSQLSRIRRLFRRRKRVKSPLALSCMQLLGPRDTYLVQSDEDDTKFWGWKYAQGLGCTFEWKGDNHTDITAMMPEEWRDKVQTGFQVLPFHFQGRLNGHDGTLGGVKTNQGISGTAEYDFTVRHIAGWGNYSPLSNEGSSKSESIDIGRQFSTAGWLANYPVFEPHWQITMANARATGSLNWNGTVYHFQDAPFYGEKNWGGAFPTKWYWAQCNSFENYPDLALTAGGGIRQLPFSFLPGKKTETLGLIGIHFNGTFWEIVPWMGDMNWKVWPWGRWEFRGKCIDGATQFEAEVIAVTEEPGVPLRAPTKDKGMQYSCRDSGYGSVTLSLWLLEWDEDVGDYVRKRDTQPLIDHAKSTQGTVEVGGGPWRDAWIVSSKMSRPLKWMVRLPYTFRNVFKRVESAK